MTFICTVLLKTCLYILLQLMWIRNEEMRKNVSQTVIPSILIFKILNFHWFKFQQTLLLHCLISKTQTLTIYYLYMYEKLKWHILKGEKKHFEKKWRQFRDWLILGYWLVIKDITLCVYKCRYLSSQVPTLFHTSSFLSLLASHSSSWSWQLARGSVEGA